MNWICWHTGSCTDPKFKLIARHTGASLSQVIHAWGYHLERAAQGEPRGHFGTIDPDEAELDTEIPRPLWMAITLSFEARGLTRDGSIVNFDKRNYGNSTLRVRAYRERQKRLSNNETLQIGSETLRNVTERSCNATGHDRTEDKILIDSSAATQSDSSAAETTALPNLPQPVEDRSRGRRNRGSRITADWEPSADDIEFATKAGLVNGQIAKAAAEFRDYWIAATGQNAIKLDWSATWRNRVRKIVEWHAARGTGTGGTKPQSGSLVAAMRGAMSKKE